jgi:hypothetical protein
MRAGTPEARLAITYRPDLTDMEDPDDELDGGA